MIQDPRRKRVPAIGAPQAPPGADIDLSPSLFASPKIKKEEDTFVPPQTPQERSRLIASASFLDQAKMLIP